MSNSNMKNLGKMIREKRIEMGYTQADLAEEIGMTQEHISKIELEKYDDISIRTAVALSRHLGIDLRQLTGDQ